MGVWGKADEETVFVSSQSERHCPVVSALLELDAADATCGVDSVAAVTAAAAVGARVDAKSSSV